MATKKITEEMKAHVDWYVRAKQQTLASLPEFLRELTEDYGHDYGTICHAVAAAAVAAASAVNAAPAGGITGFQAGAVMWEFIRHWQGLNGPARLLDYSNMLYPQYETKFDKTISPETADFLRAEATKRLADHSDDLGRVAPAVAVHWRSLAAGELPFGYRVAD